MVFKSMGDEMREENNNNNMSGLYTTYLGLQISIKGVN